MFKKKNDTPVVPQHAWTQFPPLANADSVRRRATGAHQPRSRPRLTFQLAAVTQPSPSLCRHLGSGTRSIGALCKAHNNNGTDLCGDSSNPTSVNTLRDPETSPSKEWSHVSGYWEGVFSKTFIYLFERESHGEGDLSITGSVPQTAATVITGPGQSPKHLVHLLLFLLPKHISWRLDPKWSSRDSNHSPYEMPVP